MILSGYGAGNGARTRGIKLGKLALYQLSYSRLINIIKELKSEIKWSFTGAQRSLYRHQATTHCRGCPGLPPLAHDVSSPWRFAPCAGANACPNAMCLRSHAERPEIVKSNIEYRVYSLYHLFLICSLLPSPRFQLCPVPRAFPSSS